VTAIDAITAEAGLVRVIEAGLAEFFDEPDLPPVQRVDIRPSGYRTSFPLDEVEVTLADGRRARLLRKHLSLRSLTPNAAAAKRADLFDAQREIEMYRRILAGARLGTAAFIGAVPGTDESGPWLVLEHVQGVEMYQVGTIEGWRGAAAWLATMHERLAWAVSDRALEAVRAITLGRGTWRQSMRRARAAGLGAAPARTRARLVAAHEPVIAILETIPVRLIHGDAYASNIIVDDPHAPQRVCAVDWEMTSAGPALLDLAALTAGSWPAAAVSAIAGGYVDALPASSRWRDDRAAFETALDACRFQLAVHWLGWRDEWIPPEDHRQDWVAAATASLDRIGL
jgi:aminoglycoside phosphotransferase (APT) family kinase protein